jgi:hypothetical protein
MQTYSKAVRETLKTVGCAIVAVVVVFVIALILVGIGSLFN